MVGERDLVGVSVTVCVDVVVGIVVSVNLSVAVIVAVIVSPVKGLQLVTLANRIIITGNTFHRKCQINQGEQLMVLLLFMNLSSPHYCPKYQIKSTMELSRGKFVVVAIFVRDIFIDNPAFRGGNENNV
jgi:hypothetical protein